MDNTEQSLSNQIINLIKDDGLMLEGVKGLAVSDQPNLAHAPLLRESTSDCPTKITVSEIDNPQNIHVLKVYVQGETNENFPTYNIKGVRHGFLCNLPKSNNLPSGYVFLFSKASYERFNQLKFEIQCVKLLT